MEQRHGKDPPLYGGNHEASGSRGGNGNHEEYIHRGQMEEHRSNDGGSIPSHTINRTTPRPYMPTFIDTQRRDANALDLESLGEEWETAEREYNDCSTSCSSLQSLFIPMRKKYYNIINKQNHPSPN
jgi:hypothetical protein